MSYATWLIPMNATSAISLSYDIDMADIQNQNNTSSIEQYLAQLRAPTGDTGPHTKASLKDFLHFLDVQKPVKEGTISVRPNGHIRVTWQNEEGSLVSLRFVGDGHARYVIRLCVNGSVAQRWHGKIGRTAVKQLLRHSGASDLLY